jgi:hypothetical protein
MRFIWMASAALLLSAGAACAQTTSPMQPPGASSTPATPPSTMAPPAPSAMAPPANIKNWLRGPLPENEPPQVYLHIAKAALAHHDYGRANDALSHAETLLLTRSVDQGSSIPVDNSPAVSAIELARKALQSHDTVTAMQQTDAAMQAIQPPPPGNAPMTPTNGAMKPLAAPAQ